MRSSLKHERFQIHKFNTSNPVVLPVLAGKPKISYPFLWFPRVSPSGSFPTPGLVVISYRTWIHPGGSCGRAQLGYGSRIPMGPEWVFAPRAACGWSW